MDWAVDQIYLGGRIFRQWMEDEIIYDPLVPANLAPPFGGSNVNLPKNRRVGLDLFVNWQISESIRSGLSYEYIKASFEAGSYSGGNYAGSRIPLVPEGLLDSFWELRPFDSLLMNLGDRMWEKVTEEVIFPTARKKLDDYWLFDLTVNYELSESASLFVDVENLLNEEYLSTAFGNGLYPGEGRKATFGVRYSF